VTDDVLVLNTRRAAVFWASRSFLSRGGLAVSMSSYETTGPGSSLGVAIFPG